MSVKGTGSGGVVEGGVRTPVSTRRMRAYLRLVMPEWVTLGGVDDVVGGSLMETASGSNTSIRKSAGNFSRGWV
jgi:hypothetical protein